MKFFNFFIIPIIFIVPMIHAAKNKHPKDLAIELYQQSILIKDSDLNKLAMKLKAEGLEPSNEISYTFNGGHCLNINCEYKYTISSDFYKENNDDHIIFKSVQAEINATTSGIASIINTFIKF